MIAWLDKKSSKASPCLTTAIRKAATLHSLSSGSVLLKTRMPASMALAPGARLGPYEIQPPLGAGGMGEVYRGRDTRLERTVAVKILSSHLSSDLEAEQRFDREARTIASLSHPHICTLYDAGHNDGIDYLVMEYLEGEILAVHLRKGPLPFERVLKHGVEICQGLERAHRSGIV